MMSNIYRKINMLYYFFKGRGGFGGNCAPRQGGGWETVQLVPPRNQREVCLEAYVRFQSNCVCVRSKRITSSKRSVVIYIKSKWQVVSTPVDTGAYTVLVYKLTILTRTFLCCGQAKSFCFNCCLHS